ncbi:MAG: protein-tyrosine phosphatase family protein [Terriglobia bacterium]
MADFHFVTDRLALGSSIRTPDQMREIAGAGITHVVNMQIEFDNRSLSDGTGIQVLWNGCDDDYLPKPPELFWAGVLFALGALGNPQSKVLFHCAAGIHRSPLMLLAVLRVLGHEEAAAIGMIRAARPAADFPAAYRESVEEFVREYQATAAD